MVWKFRPANSAEMLVGRESHLMNELAREQRTLRKVAWRLVPFICILYLFNILDRSNLGFARLRMQDDLGLTEAMFNLTCQQLNCKKRNAS